MVDTGPYPSDGENRAPRKHRYEKRSGHSGTRDGNPGTQDGYNSDRTESRHERSRNRPQDREDYREERTQSRHHEDRSRSQNQDRDRHYEEKEQSRNQRERSRDGYRERDKYHEHRERSRDQSEKSRSRHEERDSYNPEKNRDHYRERDNYQKERSRNHYEERDRYSPEKNRDHYRERDDYQKERSRSRSDEKERQERYLHSVDRRGPPAYSKDQEQDYPSERPFSPSDAQMNDMEYYETEGGILDCHKCKYLCTGRACCQLVEVLLNMLILICCSVSYNSTGGFTGITNLGGIYYYQFGGAYSGFSGADGEKAQTLDVQFYQLKLPTVTASMAFGGALMAFSCLLVLLGVLRVPWRWPWWLLVECALDVGIAVGYAPGLYFYFQYLQEAYNSQVCKDREALYSSKGYQGFSCALHGADIAAALFACMAIIAFFMSAFLAIKGFRTVRRTKKKPVNTLEF
ncbi:MARVEL domain-containing protein 3 isoform X1 [Mixophyes fleayi]|uniref:MARVEL domain-containing protein 3 isoform X1 n=1 Tax=Mixophyes fleayi TaxID=3061075 RepID=UPI003F4D9CF0